MASTDKPGDTWAEYRRLVLAELERLDVAVCKLAETNLEHERELVETLSACKTELIERLQTLKEMIEDRHRRIVEDVKAELETKEKHDIDELKTLIKAVEDSYHKASAEIKVIKAKAALFGFLAGLAIAIASLVAKFVWGK